MPPSSLYTLASYPEELTISALELLGTTDLQAVSLVCRSLRRIASPLLYSNIHWTWSKSEIPPITLFLRTILRRPELAYHVQTLTLDGSDFVQTCYQRGNPKITVDGSNLEEPIAFVKRISHVISYGDIWEQELRSGTMGAFLAVLLSQLPNITHLKLDHNYATEMLITGMVLTSSLCDSGSASSIFPTFQRLSSVSLKIISAWWRFRMPKNGPDILPLFYLPTLERMSVSIESPPLFTWPTSHPPNASGLRSLDLRLVREGHLGQILSVTPNLEKLTWTWFYRENIHDEVMNPTVNLDMIVNDLSHVKNTLIDLTIRALTDVSDASPELPLTQFHGSLGGLAAFEALRRAEFPLPFVVGYTGQATNSLKDIMPRNIEDLTVTDDLYLQEENEMEGDIQPSVIRRLVEHGLPPHLHGIHLLMRMYGDDLAETQEMEGEIQQLCKQIGTSFKVTKSVQS